MTKHFARALATFSAALLPPVALLVTAGAQGRTPEPMRVPAFEVFFAREHKGYSGPNPLVMKMTADSFVAEGVPLRWVIGLAYDARFDRVIGGPKWIDGTTFDITAKVGENDLARFAKLSTMEQYSLLRQVLEASFHVRVHKEARTLPIYELVVSRNGPKKGEDLQEAKDSGPEQTAKRRMAVSAGGLIRATDVSMSQLATALEGIAGRKVVDRTNLTGLYNLKLRWTPDNAPQGEHAQDAPPALLTALAEQLGLELHATRGPVDLVVVDSVDKPQPQ